MSFACCFKATTTVVQLPCTHTQTVTSSPGICLSGRLRTAVAAKWEKLLLVWCAEKVWATAEERREKKRKAERGGEQWDGGRRARQETGEIYRLVTFGVLLSWSCCTGAPLHTQKARGCVFMKLVQKQYCVFNIASSTIPVCILSEFLCLTRFYTLCPSNALRVHTRTNPRAHTYTHTFTHPYQHACPRGPSSIWNHYCPWSGR